MEAEAKKAFLTAMGRGGGEGAESEEGGLRVSKQSSKAVNQKPAEEQSVWKCPRCNYINYLEGTGSCQNPRKCDQNIGDEDVDFLGMTEEQIVKERKDFAKKAEQSQEAKPDSNDWECDYCKTMNKMVEGDIYSSIC